MYQNNETRSGIRVWIGPRGPARRPGDVPPLHVSRNGTGEPGARLRIVPAPGGAAFVEDKPASERR